MNLTEAQKQALRTLEADAVTRTRVTLDKLPDIARRFNANLVSENPDPELEKKLSQEMEDIFSEVIRIRLARIRSAARTLTSEQRQAIATELKKPNAPHVFDDLVRTVLGSPEE
jgi:hypothetical protein